MFTCIDNRTKSSLLLGLGCRLPSNFLHVHRSSETRTTSVIISSIVSSIWGMLLFLFQYSVACRRKFAKWPSIDWGLGFLLVRARWSPTSILVRSPTHCLIG